MRIRIFFPLILLPCVFFMSITSCQESKEKQIEVVNPTLNLIQISSDSLLTVEAGDVRIKRKDSQSYVKIDSILRLYYKDIIELGKGAKIRISCEDKSSIIIGPVDHTSWYTFDERE